MPGVNFCDRYHFLKNLVVWLAVSKSTIKFTKIIRESITYSNDFLETLTGLGMLD